MVRPPKPSEIKQSSSVQKSNTKMLRPDIEERYRTEAPAHRKTTDKIKSPASSPGSSLQAKTKIFTSNQKPKIVTPKSSKLSKLAKVISQQPASNISKRSTVGQSKSHTTKPDIPASPKQRSKTRKPSITKKKSPSEAKSDPMNRLLKITEVDDQLPQGFTSENEAKLKPGLSRIGKVVTGAKKVIKKASLKKSPKEPSKNLNFNLKTTEESVASLTTHFRMPYLASELNDTKVSGNKNLRPSTNQKKISRSKPDQEESTKDGKNKRKSKLHSSKHLNRVLSSDSVPVFIREIKHNDSFVISARKLQKSSSERRNRKCNPDCLKLNVRTSTTRTKPTDNLPLKSCLKKTLEGDTKIRGRTKKEGKMRHHETYHSALIV